MAYSTNYDSCEIISGTLFSLPTLIYGFADIAKPLSKLNEQSSRPFQRKEESGEASENNMVVTSLPLPGQGESGSDFLKL